MNGQPQRDGVGQGGVSVVIPTYERVPYLRRCLQALARQTVAPSEVLVVTRDTDTETQRFLQDSARTTSLPLRVLTVREPGGILPFAKGLSAVQSDYVGVTDDDAVPESHWLERIRNTFRCSPPPVGALTGPVLEENPARQVIPPAVLTWYGRFASSLRQVQRYRQPRIVSTFQEGNVAFRREALTPDLCDLRLEGGRILNHGLDIALTLRAHGWFVLYHPHLAVLHTPVRGALGPPTPEDTIGYVRTMMRIIKKHRGWRGVLPYAAYTVLAGQRDAPGILRYLTRRDTRWDCVTATRREVSHHILL